MSPSPPRQDGGKVKFSRYEVDLLLHLCLASRAEKEEIIKLLFPRLNYSQKSLRLHILRFNYSTASK